MSVIFDSLEIVPHCPDYKFTSLHNFTNRCYMPTFDILFYLDREIVERKISKITNNYYERDFYYNNYDGTFIEPEKYYAFSVENGFRDGSTKFSFNKKNIISKCGDERFSFVRGSKVGYPIIEHYNNDNDFSFWIKVIHLTSSFSFRYDEVCNFNFKKILGKL
ncbi:hypothetical protein MNB_SM-7-1317 [hydrothermal vent metagenome]|uniref:Uncharacterized protein n=1 Tax=hydrothermal vent metagenome TaxID=652676 RepID=A0A1W1BXH7_9ZZZZ